MELATWTSAAAKLPINRDGADALIGATSMIDQVVATCPAVVDFRHWWRVAAACSRSRVIWDGTRSNTCGADLGRRTLCSPPSRPSQHTGVLGQLPAGLLNGRFARPRVLRGSCLNCLCSELFPGTHQTFALIPVTSVDNITPRAPRGFGDVRKYIATARDKAAFCPLKIGCCHSIPEWRQLFCVFWIDSGL
jgi:hypothetical protein